MINTNPTKHPKKDKKKAPKERTLKPVDEAIILAYIENGGNQSAAYRTAKPNTLKWKDETVHNNSSKFFQREEVKARLNELMDTVEEKTEITAEYILNGIQDTVERCRQIAPVLNKKGEQVFTEGPEGDLVPAYTFQSQSALKGYEMLARWKGLFEKDNKQRTDPFIEILERTRNAPLGSPQGMIRDKDEHITH